jgi:hypothetical protein
MKTQTLLLTLLTALCSSPSYSQSPDEAKGIFTVTPAFVSFQTFRGKYEGGPSFQPALNYSKGPLALELFANFPLTNEIPAPDPVEHEIDFTAKYQWSIIPDAFAIESAVTLYTFPRLINEDGVYNYQIEPNLSFIYSIGHIDFLLTYYYDIVLKGPSYEAGIDWSVPIKDSSFGLEGWARIGRYDWSDTEPDNPTKVRYKGDYFNTGISVLYEFTKNTKLNVGWCYEKGTNNFIHHEHLPKVPDPVAVSRGYFNAALAYSF